MYQNPTKFDNTIEYFEFDRLNGEVGNNYVTYIDWEDQYGDHHTKGVVYGDKIPDELRLQIALQIAGDLIQPIQK